MHGVVEFFPSDTITINLAEYRAAVKASKIELKLGEAVAFASARDLIHRLPGGVATALAEGSRVISRWSLTTDQPGQPGNVVMADGGVSVMLPPDLYLGYSGPALVTFTDAAGATLAATVIEVDGAANRARLDEAEASGRQCSSPPICVSITLATGWSAVQRLASPDGVTRAEWLREAAEDGPLLSTDAISAAARQPGAGG